MMSELTSQIDSAIEAHNVWKGRLLTAIKTKKIDVDIDTIAKDNFCPFGQWLYGPFLNEAKRTTEYYKDIVLWHATFQKEADKVMRKITNNDTNAAINDINNAESAFNQASILLISALKDWKKASRP